MPNVNIKPIDIRQATLSIVGTTPLVMHRMGSKVEHALREKKLGKRSKNREILDMETECQDAMHKMSDGNPGVPATAVKSSIVGAAHKDYGVTKVQVRQALFIEADDETGLIRLQSPGWKMREDVIRVATGTPDLRYRPEFKEWALELRIQFNAEVLDLETIVNLLERAGFGQGLLEGRPEKSALGWGRFKVERGASDV